MHLQVVVQSEAGMQRSELYPANGPLTIGRHPQCSLRLDSDLVSRQHAVIQAGNGTLRVEDVSTNGTIAGDLLLRRDSVEVPYGTPIVVGDFTVFVYPAEQQNAAQHAAMQSRPMPMGTNPVDTRQRMQGSGAHLAPPIGTGPNLPNPLAQSHSGNGMMSSRPGVSSHPSATGMNPIIAHVGTAPGPSGVHLPLRGDDAKQKAEVELRREIHKLLLEHLDLAT